MPRAVGNVWDHFLMISESDRKKHVTCNYCNLQYKSAQATRLKEHLLKCPKCPMEVKNKVKCDKKAAGVKGPVSSSAKTPIATTSLSTTLLKFSFEEPTSGSFSSRASTPAACTSTASSSVVTSMSPDSEIFLRNTHGESQQLRQDVQKLGQDGVYSHEDLDTVLARAIYASGVPLSLLESEYWQDVFKLLDPTYTVPSRHSLSNPLLDAEFERIRNGIDNKLTKSVALGLICDGWTNIVGKDVINIIITTPTPIFYTTVQADIHQETGKYLGEQIIKVIDEIGPAKFVAVITDNATNMKAVWRIVTSKYPHISCLACVSHTLNLICKDLFTITLFKEILDNVVKVIKYVKRTNIVHDLFEKYQVEKYGRATRTLKMFSKTQWSGAYITLQSYNGNKEALESIATSREIDIISQIKDIILDDQFWVKIDEVLKVLQPMATAILVSEKDNALLSDVPFIFETLHQELTHKLETSMLISERDKNLIISSIQRRKDFCVQPIHYAAHQLDPRYCGVCLSDDEIAVVSEYLRQVSNMLDIEVAKVLKNMAEFRLKENFFDDSKAIWVPVNELEPRLWWQTFANNQDIAIIAIKILGVPPSAAVSDRNRSLLARTNTKTKPKLNTIRDVKLMAIRCNLGLIPRQSEENIRFVEGPTEDISGNISDCKDTKCDPLW